MTSSTMASDWTSADSARAQQIWDEYLRSHDVAQQKGQAVGIDPATGRVWFGRTALDIRDQMQAAGNPVPLFYLRVGQDHYLRKGGRR
ncbi:MAG: hypothetical protein ACKV2Q_17625 [Planctomycetaceae bacterium]